MAEYLTTDTELTGIANAIRTKGGTSAPLEFPGDFVDAIDDISTGTDTSDATATAGDILSGKTAYIATGKATGTIASKSSSDLTASGDTVSVPAGYYASAASKAVAAGSIYSLVATRGRVVNNSINITPAVRIVGGYLPSDSTNGNAATVTASELVSGTKTIDAAGTTDVTNYAAVSVPEGVEGTPTNTVSPVSNHSVIVSPRVTNTEGYIPGTQKVGNNTTIYASDLVSGTKSITQNGSHDVTNYASAEVSVPTGTARTSADLTVSGATVTAPAGLYAEAASKTVAAGSASTPATSVTANPSISVSSGGLITASVSASQSVTPSVSAGWVSSGTAGTVTVSGSNTQQLSTQAAQTITPGTTDQTIASGKYLTGAQTIKGDANLVAANIAKDVSIFGVTGTHEGGGGDIATGTFTPADATSDIVITHNLGHKPLFFAITSASHSPQYVYSGSSPQGLATFVGTGYLDNGNIYYGMRYQAQKSSGGYASGIASASNGNWNSAWYRIHVTETTITIRQANLGSYGCGTGYKKFWIAYGNIGDAT